jgi:hypothetical protein
MMLQNDASAPKKAYELKTSLPRRTLLKGSLLAAPAIVAAPYVRASNKKNSAMAIGHVDP